MRACDNPECPFHDFDVEPEMIRAGTLFFVPRRFAVIHPMPPTENADFVRQGEIAIVTVRYQGAEYHLCKVCHSAARMFAR